MTQKPKTNRPQETCPIGTLYGETRAYTLQGQRPLNTAAGYRSLIVTYRNGSPVRLGELGKVIDSVADRQGGGLVQRQTRHRARNTAPAGHQHHRSRDAVKKLLPTFREQIRPASTSMCCTTARFPYANRWTKCSSA